MRTRALLVPLLFSAPLFGQEPIPAPRTYSQWDFVGHGDLDQDGDLDLVFRLPDALFPYGLFEIQVYLNAGQGQFVPGATVAAENGIRPGYFAGLGDFDGDGRLDLLRNYIDTLNSEEGLEIRLGDGAGGFGAALRTVLPNFFPSPLVPLFVSLFASEIADFDGDGRADVATSIYYQLSDLSILQEARVWTLSGSTLLPSPAANPILFAQLTPADTDSDGAFELVESSPLKVYDRWVSR